MTYIKLYGPRAHWIWPPCAIDSCREFGELFSTSFSFFSLPPFLSFFFPSFLLSLFPCFSPFPPYFLSFFFNKNNYPGMSVRKHIFQEIVAVSVRGGFQNTCLRCWSHSVGLQLLMHLLLSNYSSGFKWLRDSVQWIWNVSFMSLCSTPHEFLNCP